jgi:hypothetical protein
MRGELSSKARFEMNERTPGRGNVVDNRDLSVFNYALGAARKNEGATCIVSVTFTNSGHVNLVQACPCDVLPWHMFRRPSSHVL